MQAGIHQPNFFPWLGFFDRIRKSHVFIFFDHVQRPGGKSWFTRVRAANKGDPIWLTIPIKKKGRTFEKIYEAEFGCDPDDLLEDIIHKLKNYYLKAKHKDETINLIENLYVKTFSVADFNINYITGIARALGLSSTLRRSSEKFQDNIQLYGSEMILETCKRFEVSGFICGGYALDNLIDKDSFLKSSVEVIPQGFIHPVYEQVARSSFVEGLSILDLLMNHGIEAAKVILQKVPGEYEFGKLKSGI
jgi:hypothetical protein